MHKVACTNAPSPHMHMLSDFNPIIIITAVSDGLLRKMVSHEPCEEVL